MRSGGALVRSVTLELPWASQRDSPESINAPVGLSLRGWRDGCDRAELGAGCAFDGAWAVEGEVGKAEGVVGL
jgi:hypothetical protein